LATAAHTNSANNAGVSAVPCISPTMMYREGVLRTASAPSIERQVISFVIVGCEQLAMKTNALARKNLNILASMRFR
jgi:hypothetical protein